MVGLSHKRLLVYVSASRLERVPAARSATGSSSTRVKSIPKAIQSQANVFDGREGAAMTTRSRCGHPALKTSRTKTDRSRVAAFQ